MINWISAKPVLLILIAVSVVSEYASGQSVGIATSTITPNTKSILELRASDKGVLLPRMTTAERGTYTLSAALGAADVGMTIFNTTTNTYEYWVGNAWVTMGTSGESDDDWTVVGGDIERQSGNVYIGDLSSTDNDLYISDDIIDWDNSTYKLDLDGTDSRLNEIEFDDGSASDPSVWFEGDGNSGLFQPADNQIAIAAAGNERLRVESGGVAIGGNSDSPNTRLDVVGGTSGSTTNLFTVRSDYTANSTGTGIRLVNSTSPTSDVGAAFEAVTTDAANGLSSLRIKVHGSGGASGDLEERLRINGDGEVIIGSNGYRGKLSLFAEQGATDYAVSFSANPSTTQDVNYTLPADDGDADQVLRTDGSGILTWVDGSSLSDLDWTVSGSDQYSAVSGNVGIGATSPYSKLEVYDASGPTLTITKDGADASSIFFRNGTGGGVNDGTSLGLSTAEHFELTNSISGKDMFFNVNVGGTPTDVLFLDGGTGGVGINNTAPDYELDVSGDIGVDGEIIHNGDTHTKIAFTSDRIRFYAGNASDTWIDIQEDDDEMTFNEEGRNDRDLRVEGDTDANLIMVDASQDNVGIGGAPDPDIKLDVNGYSAATNQVTIIPLWQAGSNYTMNNTSGSDLSNCESGINPDIYEPNGNLEVKLVIRVTSTSGGTVGNFQLRTHNGSTETYPIVSGDAWTWASTQAGYVVTSPWKSWAAGTNAAELHIHGWVNGGSSLNFNSAYLLVRAQQN